MTKKHIALLALPLVLFACKPQAPVTTIEEDEQEQQEELDAAEEGTENYDENAVNVDEQQIEAEGEPANDPNAVSDAEPDVQEGQYAGFEPEVLVDGQTKVLFFHAGWCPICQSADEKLQQWYGAGGVPISTYQVDYDTSPELKQEYGITYQHTFVKVDGDGNMVERIQGPTDAQLKVLLGAA